MVLANRNILLKKHISIPIGERLHRITNTFFDLRGLPNMYREIDGTHIKLC